MVKTRRIAPCAATALALPIPAAVRGTLALQAVTLVPGRLVLGEACEVRVD